MIDDDTAEIECPHCEFGYCYGGDAMGPDEEDEEDCPSCGRTFWLKQNVSYWFTARVKDDEAG